jgi:hypothetical protein
MRVVRVLSCLLVVVAVGCGREGAISSVSAPGAVRPTATTTPQAAATDAPATAAPTAAPVATSTPATSAPRAAATPPMSESALKVTLLTANDLPGWSEGGPSSGGGDEGDDEFEPCGEKASSKYEPTHEASKEYNQGQIGDQLHLTNESHPSAAHAAANIKEAKDQVKKCPTWSETQDDGTKVTFKAEEVPFPNIADETVAIHIEVVFSGSGPNGEPFEVHGDGLAVGARLGQNIVGLVHMAFGINTHPQVDRSETESIARKAVAKFKRTA